MDRPQKIGMGIAAKAQAKAFAAYEKAEAAVLFEGFSVKNNTTYNSGVQWISISNISGFYIQFAYRGEEIGIEFHNGNSGYLKTYAHLAEATQDNPLTIKKKQL